MHIEKLENRLEEPYLTEYQLTKKISLIPENIPPLKNTPTSNIYKIIKHKNDK